MRPCHHDTAFLRVAAGGDGHQLWMVAANILTKLSRRQDYCWSCRLEAGLEANNPLSWKNGILRIKKIDFDSFFGKIEALENGHELWNVECGVLM